MTTRRQQHTALKLK